MGTGKVITKSYIFETLFSALIFLFAGMQFRLSGVLIVLGLIGIIDVVKQKQVDSTLALLVFSFFLVIFTQTINSALYLGDIIQIPKYAQVIPFSLDRDMSIMSLAGWLVVGVLVLSVGLHNKIRARDYAITVSIFVAVLGLIQHYTQASGFYWMIPFDTAFFSVFGYVNNAASFFLLASCLALSRRVSVALPLVTLFWWCSWVVGCRYVMITIPILTAFTFVPVRYRRQAFYIIIALYFCFAGFCADYLAGDRWQEYQVNIGLISRFPLWGSGSWGNYILSSCFAPDYIREIYRTSPNSHNDLMMFAVEYGIAGVLILFSVCWVFVSRHRAGLQYSHTLTGLIFLAGHSLIDMPLHCPAVVAMAVVVVATNKTKEMKA